jgi:hypothetical protein
MFRVVDICTYTMASRMSVTLKRRRPTRSIEIAEQGLVNSHIVVPREEGDKYACIVN